jgi:hypothetical protein
MSKREYNARLAYQQSLNDAEALLVRAMPTPNINVSDLRTPGEVFFDATGMSRRSANARMQYQQSRDVPRGIIPNVFSSVSPSVNIPIPQIGVSAPSTPGQIFEASTGLARREYNARLQMQTALEQGVVLEQQRVSTLTANLSAQGAAANNRAATLLSNRFSGSNLDAYTRQSLLRGLPDGGSITSDAGLVSALRGQGMSTEQIDDALGGLATKVDESADSFNMKIVDAAGQVANVFTALATGKATAGGVIGGLGSAAAGIVGTFNPLAGAIVGTASGVLGGLFDAFGQNDRAAEQERLANQNRQLPSLTVEFNFDQYNQWQGQPSDNENLSALTGQNKEMLELMTQYVIPTLKTHSNKLGLT